MLSGSYQPKTPVIVRGLFPLISGVFWAGEIVYSTLANIWVVHVEHVG